MATNNIFVEKKQSETDTVTTVYQALKDIGVSKLYQTILSKIIKELDSEQYAILKYKNTVKYGEKQIVYIDYHVYSKAFPEEPSSTSVIRVSESGVLIQ